MSYIKKYEIGNIALDVPRTDFIYELPLLSFGDVQHTIGLSLVFNSRFATSNPFYMANGYKLNMQKRLIMSNGVPVSYEDGYGKLTKLNKQGDRYSFDDDSQRFIGAAGSDFRLDNSDYSSETYDNQGRIKSVTDKYGVTYLVYTYNGSGKLSSITFRSNKIIRLIYGTSGVLNSIAYSYNGSTVCTTNIAYNGSASAIVTHYSGVKYYIAYSGGNFTAYSTDGGATYSDSYSHRLDCTKTNTSIVIQNKIGSKVTSRTQYDFVKLTSENKIVLMDVTDFHGVKTRMQFDGENLVYSYEFAESMFTPDETTPNYTYLGKVNYHIKNQISGVQSYTDGIKMTYIVDEYGTRFDRFRYSQDASEAIMLTGWLKSIDNVSECNITFYNGESYAGSASVSIPSENSWTYFCVGVPSEDLNNMSVSIGISKERVLMADFRLVFNENDNHTTTEETVFILNSAEIYPIDDETEFYFCTEQEAASAIESGDYSSLNKLNLAGHYITANDIVRYQINKIKGNYTNEAYIDNCRHILINAKPLMVKLENNLWDVTAVSIGKRYERGDRTYLTRNNVLNGDVMLTTVSYINGTEISRQEYNTSFDVVNSTTDGLGTVFQYALDEYGRGTGLVTRKTVGAISTTASYDLTDFKLVSTTDEYNVTTTYTTDPVWGVVTATSCSGESVEDSFDQDKSVLEQRTFGGSKTHSFGYSGGNLTSLSSGNLTYGFTYNCGSLATVSKCSAQIEKHVLSDSDKVLTSSYPDLGNAIYSVVQRMDNYGRLAKIENELQNTYDINPTHSGSSYNVSGVDNGAGKLALSEDMITGNKTRYAYNNYGVSKVGRFNSAETKISEESFDYDSLGRLTKNTYTFGTKTVGNSFTYLLDENAYNADERIGSASYLVNGVSKATATNYYDSYKKIRRKLINLGSTYDREITYVGSSRISRVLDVKNGSTINNVSYTYDTHGRITGESDSVNTNANTTYVYDSFGQLIRENNKALDKTFVYEYNEIGGISSVKEYAYTTAETPSGSASTKSFGYDLTQKDRLTLFGLKSITYDSLGCVKTYDGWTYGWNKGRLASIQKGSLSTSRENYGFTYNGYGQRTKVTYSFFPGQNSTTDYLASSTTEYFYDNSGRLIRESYSGRYNDNTTVTREYIFLYDESGIVGCLFAKNGATPAAYFYRKNLQGDVTAIYNESGNKVGKYAYDAWGNCTVLSGAATDVVRYNPIRYRGYYYDIETGLYYLNARYYNPQFRRFISPDDSSYLDPETPNGLNLYAYCNNDPVNYKDPSGRLAITTTAIIVGAFIGFVIGATSSVVTQLEEHNGDWSQINVWEVAFDGAFGAINGGLAASGINIWWSMGLGAVLGFGSSVGKDYFFNKKNIDWCAAINSFFIGAIAGAIAGAGANYAKDGMQVTKFVNSRNILNRTIANGTKRAIARQTHAMNVHAIQLLISGVRYMGSNTASMIYTMCTN